LFVCIEALFLGKSFILLENMFLFFRFFEIMFMMKYSFLIMLLFTSFVFCEEKNLLKIDENLESVQPALFSAEEIYVQNIIASMSNAELAAQVLMTGIDGDVHLTPYMAELLQEIPAGAVMLFKYNLTGNLETIKNLLQETSSFIKEAGQEIPPFIAVDHEGGYVHRFSAGVTKLPAARTYFEKVENENRDEVLQLLRDEVFSSGKELAALGINMNLAPVAEIENDENALFLDTRSYGPDADFTALAVSTFAEAMLSAGILPVLKHFPGSSSVDPHTGVAILAQNRNELDAMIMPFHQAMQNGNARAVMISHSIVSALDTETNGSLSTIVIQHWLREELGFKGIIIADDFSMKAVTSRGMKSEDAIIQALNAGINLVMVWPKDLKKTFEAILFALEHGMLSRETLESRVEIILLEKINIGIRVTAPQ
jgi:beta-N-acetylhexosaminidase